MADGDKAAIIHAAAARALIKAMGMQAANAERAVAGRAPVYIEGDFLRLVYDEGIGWNAVLEVLRG